MKTQCPNCKARFNANETSVGKQAKCPKCGQPFTIEAFIETPASPAKRGEPVAVEPPAKDVARPEAATKNPSTKSEILNKSQAPKPKIQNELETRRAGDDGYDNPIPEAAANGGAPPAKSAEPVETPVKMAEPMKEEKPESKAPSKTLSKAVFVYCWMALRIIAGILGLSGLMLAIRLTPNIKLGALAAFAAADVFLVCSVAIELMLFYRMWAAIGDDKASVSAAKAVGFLFIPVFNIYWALLMITGFVEDYNSFIHRRSVKTKDLPFALFLIYAFAFILAATVVTTPMVCVFAFVGLINRAFIGYPDSSWLLFFLAFAAGTAHFITYILVAIRTCDAINVLPETKGR